MVEIKRCVSGFLYCTCCFLTATFGAIFIMGPVLPLMYFKERWFRWYMDFAVRMWLVLPGAMFEILYGTKIVITGDRVEPNDRSLIIMNHRCRLDWLFFWMVNLRAGRLANQKIVMKSELKNVPGFGWSMQNLLFFFLQRRWDIDHSYLDKMLDYFIDLDYPLQLFIFPEGTNLCRNAKGKSDSFAEKNNLPKYEYVLHPRVTGFNYLVEKLRGNIIDTIHDVTVGYPYMMCYGEKDLFAGNFPDEIHVCYKRYAITDLPVDSEGVGKWCADRWREKEERLESFYKNKKFVGQPVHYEDEGNRYRSVMIAILMFWLSFLVVVFYLLCYFTVARWYSLILVLFYVLAGIFAGGTDSLQLNLHDITKNK